MSRELCANCERPLAVCYCSALVQIANKIKVVIIQHPLEQNHPFNTGRIAHLCLGNSDLVVTEVLSDEALEQLLSTDSALLYPSSLPWLPKTLEISGYGSDKPESLEALSQPSIANIQQLVVIDATWRKSKKILHLHPRLQTLPRVNLTGNLTSSYQVRKTSVENGLSTLESIVEAMQILEPDSKPNTDFRLMLKPFEKMIALQQSVQGLNSVEPRKTER